jgi:phenylacetate-CoA ligase
VDGRSDEVLHLPERAGQMVAVAPSTFRNVLGTTPGVAEYQVILEPEGLWVWVVPLPGAEAAELQDRVVERLRRRLEELDVLPEAIRVELVPALARQNGKLKLVRSEVG